MTYETLANDTSVYKRKSKYYSTAVNQSIYGLLLLYKHTYELILIYLTCLLLLLWMEYVEFEGFMLETEFKLIENLVSIKKLAMINYDNNAKFQLKTAQKMIYVSTDIKIQK